MIDKLLDKILRWQEKRVYKKMGGIPLVTVLYNPNQEIPNIIYNCHPSLHHDEYVRVRFKEVADHLRENYVDEWDFLKQ